MTPLSRIRGYDSDEMIIIEGEGERDKSRGTSLKNQRRIIMSKESILPEKENLRRAVRWISDQGDFSLKVIEEASVRFDLSPSDESFLLNHFTKKED